VGTAINYNGPTVGQFVAVPAGGQGSGPVPLDLTDGSITTGTPEDILWTSLEHPTSLSLQVGTGIQQGEEYIVRLYFLETEGISSVFDVIAEGQQVLGSYDPNADIGNEDAGIYGTTVKTFMVTTLDDSLLEIGLDGTNPHIAAIEVIEVT
jgi:hypothetical protein